MTTDCTVKPTSGSEQRSPLASGSVREHLFRGAVGLPPTVRLPADPFRVRQAIAERSTVALAYRESAMITRCVHGPCCPVDAPDDAPPTALPSRPYRSLSALPGKPLARIVRFYEDSCWWILLFWWSHPRSRSVAVVDPLRTRGIWLWSNNLEAPQKPGHLERKSCKPESSDLQLVPTSGRQDLNLRPPGPQPGALPDCATPRDSPIITGARAGDGNRTRPKSLEGFCATTTLRPRDDRW